MNLDTASRLLAYTRLLRKVVSNDSFDFSVAGATARWLAETLQSSTPEFDPLRGIVQNLTDAVSLSSGLGIAEIWSAFLVEEAAAAGHSDLQLLEQAVRHSLSGSFFRLMSVPRRTYTFSGVRTQVFQLMALRALPAKSREYEQAQLVDLEKQVLEVCFPSPACITEPYFIAETPLRSIAAVYDQCSRR